MSTSPAPAAPAKTSSTNNDNVMAVVASIPVVGLIMFLVMKDASPLVKNYAKQSNAILALSILTGIVSVFFGVMFIFLSLGAVATFLGWVLNILTLVAWVMLAVNAYNGKMYKLPVVGDFFDGLLK